MVHKRYCTGQGGCIEVPWRTGRVHRAAMWVRVCKSAQEMPGGSGRMQCSTGWVLQKCAGVYKKCPTGWEWGTGCRAGVHERCCMDQRCKGVQNGLGRLNGGAQVAGMVQVQRLEKLREWGIKCGQVQCKRQKHIPTEFPTLKGSNSNSNEYKLCKYVDGQCTSIAKKEKYKFQYRKWDGATIEREGRMWQLNFRTKIPSPSAYPFSSMAIAEFKDPTGEYWLSE